MTSQIWGLFEPLLVLVLAGTAFSLGVLVVRPWAQDMTEYSLILVLGVLRSGVQR